MEGLKTLLGDCDTGWHIRTGEWIVANHGVPRARYFLLLQARGRLVCVGVAVGRAVRLAQPAWRAGDGRNGFDSSDLGHVRASIPADAAEIQRRSWRSASPWSRRRLRPIHWLARPHLFTLLFVMLFYGALERVRRGRVAVWGIPYLAILPVATVCGPTCTADS